MSGTTTTSVKDKIRFFDDWVKQLIEVDPREVRANARRQAPPPPEIKAPPPTPPVQTVETVNGNADADRRPSGYDTDALEHVKAENSPYSRTLAHGGATHELSDDDDNDDDGEQSSGYDTDALEHVKPKNSPYSQTLAHGGATDELSDDDDNDDDGEQSSGYDTDALEHVQSKNSPYSRTLAHGGANDELSDDDDNDDDGEQSSGYDTDALEHVKPTNSPYSRTPAHGGATDELSDDDDNDDNDDDEQSSGYDSSVDGIKAEGSSDGDANKPGLRGEQGGGGRRRGSYDSSFMERVKAEGASDDDASATGLPGGEDGGADETVPQTGPVQPQTATGMEGLALGEKYRGEESAKGWQTGRRDHEGRQFRTKYYDDDQKDDSKVDFDGRTGKAKSDSETLTGERGYVVDPETGDVHQFKDGGEVEGNEFVTTHHSTPLAGGDVAGAGMMEFKKGRLTDINDRSGHYKPGGKFTFQAVRAVNMATLSDELKAMLRKTVSTLSKKGGKAESPDTMQQLVAAEVQKQRLAYFDDLTQARRELEAEAATFADEKDRLAALDEIETSYREKANAFRDIAQKVEQDLLKNLPQNPLLDTTVANEADHTDKSLPKKVRELAKTQEAVRGVIEEMLGADPKADVAKLRQQDAALTAALVRLGFNDPKNKETKVSLLGKSGMLSDEEYDLHRAEAFKVIDDPAASDADKAKARQKFDDDLNRASAIKQLRQPLGQEAVAQLLKQGPDKVREALRQAGLKPGEPGALDKLTAKLGEARAAALSEQEITEASKKYKVGKVARPGQGVELFGFDIGKATQATLTAQQFLQTGGNEAQIRTKDRLTDEIKGRAGDIAAGTATQAADFGRERARMIAAKQKQLGDGAQLSDQDLQEIDEAIEKQQALRESFKQEAAQDQTNPSLVGDIDEANKKMAEASDQALEDVLAEVANNPIIQRKKITARLDDIEDRLLSVEQNIEFYEAEGDTDSVADFKEQKKALEEEAESLKQKMQTL